MLILFKQNKLHKIHLGWAGNVIIPKMKTHLFFSFHGQFLVICDHTGQQITTIWWFYQIWYFVEEQTTQQFIKVVKMSSILNIYSSFMLHIQYCSSNNWKTTHAKEKHRQGPCYCSVCTFIFDDNNNAFLIIKDSFTLFELRYLYFIEVFRAGFLLVGYFFSVALLSLNAWTTTVM